MRPGAEAQEYRIIDVRSGRAALIDPEFHPEATAARLQEDFPAGTWFEVYDYGVGDELVFPYTASVKRTGPGVYEVKSEAPVTITLPDGARTEG